MDSMSILELTEQQYISKVLSAFSPKPESKDTLDGKFLEGVIEAARQEYWQKRDELEDSEYNIYLIHASRIVEPLLESDTAVVIRHVRESGKCDYGKDELRYIGSYSDCAEYCKSNRLKCTQFC